MAQQATASSANVAALQVALKAMGLYPVAVDGVKGPFTARGVRAFQQRHRLLVDGVAGPQTRQRPRPARPPDAWARASMHRGQRGWDVAALQFLLPRRGFQPGGFDGGFGNGTHTALVSFQRAAGLTADGLAGSATLGALRHRSGGPTRTPTGPVRFYRPVPGADRRRLRRPARGRAAPLGSRLPGRLRHAASEPREWARRCSPAGTAAATGTSSSSSTGSATRPGTPTCRASPPGPGEHVEGGTRHRLRRLDRALDRPAPALRGAPQQRAGQPGPVPAGRHRGARDGRRP